MVARIEDYVRNIADALDVRGLLNVQFAVKYDPGGTDIYVIEANPRASRTVPFVAKATGVPLAKVASRVMMGATLAELRDEGLMRDRVVGEPCGGQGSGFALQPVPGSRPGPGPGNAVHW